MIPGLDMGLITRNLSSGSGTSLTFCMLGNLSCFCCRLLTFFQNKLFKKKFFQEHDQSVKHSVGPDLGPNCFQRLSTEDKGCR